MYNNGADYEQPSRRFGEVSEPSDGTAKANPCVYYRARPESYPICPTWADTGGRPRHFPLKSGEDAEHVVRLRRKKSVPLWEFRGAPDPGPSAPERREFVDTEVREFSNLLSRI